MSSGSDDEQKVLPARSAASTGTTSTESIEEKMPAATLITTTGSSMTRTQQDEDDIIADAYTKTQELLSQPSSFLAPFPSVVSLRDLVQEPLTCSATPSTAACTSARAISAAYAIGATQAPPQAPLQQPSSSSSMSLLEDSPTSLLSPNKGHHTLFRALEELEGLEKDWSRDHTPHYCKRRIN